MFYYEIEKGEEHIAEGLLRLKEGFVTANVPARSGEETLMLATWNIREFGKSKMGLRGKEPLYYIAEILSRFDLVAIQEVRGDLRPLKKVREILGSSWATLLTDVTAGGPGNSERLTFLYNTEKVRFGGLAGEIVIPPTAHLEPSRQLARTPYLVGFTAGWFRFMICTVHILYGTSKADDPNRVREIEELGKFLARMAKDENRWADNLIVLGDFNIFDTSDVTMQALTTSGFVVPQQLQKLPANAAKDKHYDQIAFLAPDVSGQLELCRAGVFDYYDYVYRSADESRYAPEFGNSKYNTWKTFQMSDHLPMWIELKVDFGVEYLKKKAGER